MKYEELKSRLSFLSHQGGNILVTHMVTQLHSYYYIANIVFNTSY